MTDHALTAYLAAAVPLAIADLKARGGPTDTDQATAGLVAQQIAEEGDVLLYGGPGAGRYAAELARAIAVLSFRPGGIEVFGQRWGNRWQVRPYCPWEADDHEPEWRTP